MDETTKKVFQVAQRVTGATDGDEVIGKLLALEGAPARVEALGAEVAELKGKLEARDRGDMIAVAKREARLTPAIEASAEYQQLAKDLPLPQFGAYLRSLPVALPTTVHTPKPAPEASGAKPTTGEPGDDAELTADERAWAKKYGLTDEQMRKGKQHVATQKAQLNARLGK